MTSRAVVILTEPEQCELAGPDVLVQAMLEVQQLSKAGLAASQAFCDHPAAAMKFIEAYTKAYPELQLRSSDLPLPEQLYSIVADGRVMPLRAPAALEGAKPGEASQLYPLYVLSLGCSRCADEGAATQQLCKKRHPGRGDRSSGAFGGRIGVGRGRGGPRPPFLLACRNFG